MGKGIEDILNIPESESLSFGKLEKPISKSQGGLL
jgi:hypothetical protein